MALKNLIEKFKKSNEYRVFQYLNNITCVEPNHEEKLKMMHPADRDFKQVMSQSTIQIKK